MKCKTSYSLFLYLLATIPDSDRNMPVQEICTFLSSNIQDGRTSLLTTVLTFAYTIYRKYGNKASYQKLVIYCLSVLYSYNDIWFIALPFNFPVTIFPFCCTVSLPFLFFSHCEHFLTLQRFVGSYFGNLEFWKFNFC